MRTVPLIGLAAVALVLASGVSPGQDSNAERIAQECLPSVGLIVMQDEAGNPLSFGSGFLVAKETVATCLHVAEGASSGYIKFPGKKDLITFTQLLASDPAHDLALIRARGPGATLLTLELEQPSPGQRVYALGNPQGLAGSISEGIVSAVREAKGEQVLQVTAPISPGSSGGPIVGSDGRVLGVAVATMTGGQNLNFAVPAGYVKELLAGAPDSAEVPLPGTNSALAGLAAIAGSDVGSLTEAITVDRVRSWRPMFGGTRFKMVFRVQNNLHRPVTNLTILFVFRDLDGVALGFMYWDLPSGNHDPRKPRELPGRLAIMAEGIIDDLVANEMFSSCYKRVTKGWSNKKKGDYDYDAKTSAYALMSKCIEVRVLNFDIAE